MGQITGCKLTLEHVDHQKGERKRAVLSGGPELLFRDSKAELEARLEVVPYRVDDEQTGAYADEAWLIAGPKSVGAATRKSIAGSPAAPKLKRSVVDGAPLDNEAANPAFGPLDLELERLLARKVNIAVGECSADNHPQNKERSIGALFAALQNKVREGEKDGRFSLLPKFFMTTVYS